MKGILRPCQEQDPQQIKLSELPVGTEFYACNGGWYGSIVLKDGIKCVSNEMGVFPFTKENEALVHEVKMYGEDHRSSSLVLYNADPNCEHVIEAQWGGGIKCIKCKGWFCA